MTEVTGTTSTTQTCVFHPGRETLLRCNRCERPICNECAVLTPTGYRCKECVRGQRKVFDTAKPVDYVLGVLIAGVLGFLGSYLANVLGFFILFVGPIVGVIIAEAVRFAVRKRRSLLLYRVTTIAAVVGALALPAFSLLTALSFGYGGISLLRLLWPIVYTVMLASSLYYRLSGIQIR